MYSCQGLNLSSSGVLLKAIENFSKICKSNSKIFNFDNSEDYVFDFKPGEGKEVKGKNQPKKENKTNPKDKKDKDKDKNKQQEQDNVNPDEEFNKIIIDYSSVYNNKRFIPNSI